jgi:23S rRNA (uracil1939-C5)-methyltransferase
MADEVVRALNLDGTQTVLDLYSGVGTFGLLIAGQAAAVVAIEENDEARRCAQENAERNGVTNWRQLPGRVEECLPRVQASDVAIVDPPRKGLGPEVIDLMAAAGVKRIAYVSCDPATLARDVKRFIDRGYALGAFVLCDMFPQTYHIEALAVLAGE